MLSSKTQCFVATSVMLLIVRHPRTIARPRVGRSPCRMFQSQFTWYGRVLCSVFLCKHWQKVFTWAWWAKHHRPRSWAHGVAGACCIALDVPWGAFNSGTSATRLQESNTQRRICLQPYMYTSMFQALLQPLLEAPRTRRLARLALWACIGVHRSMHLRTDIDIDGCSNSLSYAFTGRLCLGVRRPTGLPHGNPIFSAVTPRITPSSIRSPPRRARTKNIIRKIEATRASSITQTTLDSPGILCTHGARTQQSSARLPDACGHLIRVIRMHCLRCHH